MLKRHLRHLLASVLLIGTSILHATHPNIIFMMADDLGYNDVGAYGQTRFPTPNMDRLASEGIRLTTAHSPSPVCTPTRYSVLTGTDPFRRYVTSHVLFNAEPLLIEKNQLTIAKLLQQAGYATGVVGKWHLGLGDNLPRNLDRPGRGPNEIGFDYSFLVPDGHNMHPQVYHENGEIVGGVVPSFNSKLQAIDRLGFKLLVHSASNSWPNRRPAEEIGRTLADKVDAFIEENSKRPFFLYYPTHSIHHPHLPDRMFEGKSGIGPHGDFVMEFDWAVGRVMKKLKQLGLTGQTLLIVTSDNGGLNVVNGHRPSDPWRGMKASEYEGGTRVPFIARWPGEIKQNTVSSEFVSLVDIFATTADISDIQIPRSSALDSFNMLPVLKGEISQRPYLITGTRGMTRLAIRSGGWKLIVDSNDLAKNELYNLAEDPTERQDISEAHPEKVKSLSRVLRDYITTGSSRPNAQQHPSSLAEILAQKQKRNRQIAELMGEKPPPSAVPLATGPPAKFEVRAEQQAVSIAKFKTGEQVFSDRPYKILSEIDFLSSKTYLKSPLGGGTKLRCVQAGWVWVVTPAKHANPDSLEDSLLAKGFERTDMSNFQLFSNRKSNRCLVYQKYVNLGDTVQLKKWGVLLATFSQVKN